MRMSNGTAVLIFSVLIFLWTDVILKLGKYEIYSVEMLFTGVLAFVYMECKNIEYSS